MEKNKKYINNENSINNKVSSSCNNVSLSESFNTSFQKDIAYRSFLDVTLPPYHKILLTFKSTDQLLRVPLEQSYDDFLINVEEVYPDLDKPFTLVNADFITFNEEKFNEVMTSGAPETWLLILSDKEKDFKLERPRFELLKYDVHPNALTQSGNYHFSSPYQAICEFIDNGIQATNDNPIARDITIYIFSTQKIICILDNGKGMYAEEIKAFLSYFLTQKDRGIDYEEPLSYGFLDGNISKFGVGATQAGFYLGNTIKVVTKTKDSKFINEISISKDVLHERAKYNQPVFVDEKCIRAPGDTSTLDLNELQCIKFLVDEEIKRNQFTMIVIKQLKTSHINYICKDNGFELSNNLSHVYHYYLHGICGKFKKLDFKQNYGLTELSRFHEPGKPNVNIVIGIDKGGGLKYSSLADVDTDLQSQYQMRLKSVFTFCLNLNIEGVSNTQIVQGCLMYFPNNFGEETLPSENSLPSPMFQCFWQGRLAPLSYVNSLEFCAKPEGRTRKQRDCLPDACFNRIRGLLFFNYHTPISNNKLKILLDTQRDLSFAMSEASSTKKLPKEFKKWLQQCHRLYDKEVIFDHPLPDSEQSKNDDIFYGQVKMITPDGESIYKSGDFVQIDWKPQLLGKIIYFVRKMKSSDVSTFIYSRLPEDVYGNQMEEKPLMRIAGLADKVILKSTFASERVSLPKYMKVFEASDPSKEVSKKMTCYAGVQMKEITNFWVVVYNSNHEPITDVHQRKISVKVELTERTELVNSQPIDKKYMFKPFYFDKVGTYVLTFSVLLNNNKLNPELSKSIEINVKASYAEILNLHESSPDEVPLGVNIISFLLSFHDVYENSTNLFKNNETSVKLSIKCEDLIISGVQDSYTPDSNGKLKVSGIAVLPNKKEINRNRDYEFWIDVQGIGDVMFPITLLTGPPEKCILKTIPKEYENFDSFPELEVKLLDKWNQPSVLQDKSHQLALECDAFSQPILFSTVVNSRAKFPSSTIKLLKMSSTVSKTVKIELVAINLTKKRPTIQSILKILTEFEIQIFPSKACQRIVVVHDNKPGNSENLQINAAAGSIVKNLKIIGFNQQEIQMTDEELLSQNPQVTTTWAEAESLHLPLLPDLYVPTITHLSMHSVHCCFSYNGFDVHMDAKVKLNVLPDIPTKWAFVPLTLNAFCGGKKELTNATKVVAYDKYHNLALNVNSVPIITVQHSRPELNVVYSGSLVRVMNEFIFTSSSILYGNVGKVILTVQDDEEKLIKDSIQIQLNCGPAAKISLKCESFQNKQNDEVPRISLLSHSFIQSSIHCQITDLYGNPTSIKTGVELVWEPKTAGVQLVKKTNISGEMVFRKNSIKCLAEKGNVQIKVFTPDMNAIEPRFIDVEILQSNLVTSIALVVEESIFTALSQFPTLKVFHKTSDNVPVAILKSNISINIISPTGKNIDSLAVYKSNLQSYVDDVLICVPDNAVCFEESGIWTIDCSYIESRPALVDIVGKKPLKSELLKINVYPGPAVRIASTLAEETVLFASYSDDLNARLLLPLHNSNDEICSPVSLFVLDNHGNRASLTATVSINVEPIDINQNSIVNTFVPELEQCCSSVQIIDGNAILPKISLSEKLVAKMGIYNLVFSCMNLEPLKIKLSYSTNEEAEKVTQEIIPLKAELNSYKNILKLKQKDFEKWEQKVQNSLSSVTTLFQSSNPSIHEIDNQILVIQNKNYDYEIQARQARLCRKDPLSPPPNVRQYIKGLVCELAFVSDPNLSKILSWYVQSKMRVALCETLEQQRKVYELGYPAYSESLIHGYYKNNLITSQENLIPIKITPPPNFLSPIRYAINLLEFKEGYSYLRSTLYWSLFSYTLVVNTLDDAQRYREHIIRQNNTSCHAILTLNGDLIASDGLMDPQRRCPKSIENLKYAFGELPATERKEYNDLQHERRRLEELRKLRFSMVVAEQDVQQSVKNLRDKEETLMPQIIKLEQKRENLKRLADDNLNLTPNKRKKEI
ncbi:structural maintenance of chromosomes flexible hinge domain-containing protein 1 isoform X3 [Hydra vulgaris]|uniref:Structural maintenance of chromosomes flexible hinge domain-containing protein 1 isoform X3 n=1 Tax=Hydra vulgaris TaxID=6087 RepID=A0ABM4CEN9_HYDVU